MKVPTNKEQDEYDKALYRLNSADAFYRDVKKIKVDYMRAIESYTEVENHNIHMENIFPESKLNELSGIGDWKSYRQGLKDFISKLEISLSNLDLQRFDEWKLKMEEDFPELKKRA